MNPDDLFASARPGNINDAKAAVAAYLERDGEVAGDVLHMLGHSFEGAAHEQAIDALLALVEDAGGTVVGLGE